VSPEPTAPVPATWPPDLGTPHRLVLVRHGRTAHTAENRISGAGTRPSPSLDEVGRAQARAAAVAIAALAQESGPVDDLLASHLLRTRQTAETITAHLGIPGPVVEQAWAEADFGAWEGLTVADVITSHPGAWEAMLDDDDLAPPSGESFAAVRGRVLDAWTRVAVPGRTSVVVTHLTPIRVVLAAALDLSRPATIRLAPEPGSLTIVERWRDGGARVVVVGERPPPV
jgi:probable phosphoglycerate mutase